MRVLKRDGEYENISFDKVLQRIRKASRGLQVNPDALAQQVLSQIYDGVKTEEIDDLTAQLAASLSTNHPDWATLAARIAISNHQKKTSNSFCKVMLELAQQKNPKTGEDVCFVHQKIVDICNDPVKGKLVDEYIKYERDYEFDFFGFKTLERAYLLKDANRTILERPQHLWMRVGLALWPDNLDKAFETYDLLSEKKFTHATPTLFSAGTPREQLSSCFLLQICDDSISGIYKTLSDCALISKYAGGIGVHAHNIRARGSAIRGTNGLSNGIVPMLRVFNNTARYVDQCFTPDTIIYTENGPKVIEEVSITDKVLTSKGTFENVNLPIRHDFDGKMLEIQLKHAIYPIRVTGEHQIQALKGQQKGLNYDVIKNRLEKNIVKEEFYDANELSEGDFLVFPIPEYEKDINNLSEEDCRFYGILLGDGYISTKESGVHLNNTTKTETYNFVLEYCEKRGIKTYTNTNDKTETIKWQNSSPGFKFTKNQIYDENKQKKIDIPFLHLPKNKILQIIKGLIETDGCIGSKEISIELSSYPLIESLRYLLLRIGALTSGYERNRVGNLSTTKDIMTQLPTAVLRIPRIKDILNLFPKAPEGEHFTYLTYKNKLYSRIQNINEINYKGIVHDFEINDPHDYVVAHLGISHNGGGKRNGSFAIYLEPWHADVEDFLKLKLPTGAEEERARDLFYALWIPDLFMKRVEEGGNWSLFCPDEAPGLADVTGDAFEALYTQYEKEGRARKTLPAQKLWFQVLDAQMETGTPYLVYKDAANLKSNQQNVGVIKSSNLCSEILEYSDANESAVCNLASLSLPAFIKNNQFDFNELRRVTRVAIRNLNRVIDINFYPTPETKKSNMRHRPVGLGIQGLADVFALLHMDWEGEEAQKLNQLIFEHIYYAAVDESSKIGLEEGSYETFIGSPANLGKLQPDLWGVTPITEEMDELDWKNLRKRASVSLRNSLLLAPMPTASTSQILGNNECFEPFTSNLYTRRTLAGEFIIVNKYLLKELMDLGLWSDAVKQEMVMKNGSVQGIDSIPEDIQKRYKTAWELKQRCLIDMAAARGAFVCQSQSLNLFVADATYAKLTSMHFYGWHKGLKTGCYYLRTKAPVMAQKFTVDPRLASALQSGSSSSSNMVEEKEDDSDSDSSDSESDSEEKREQDAKSFKERMMKAKAAVDAGGDCLMCGS
jgi:ribonucleoside-diphosphate reductase alpha chain